LNGQSPNRTQLTLLIERFANVFYVIANVYQGNVTSEMFLEPKAWLSSLDSLNPLTGGCRLGGRQPWGACSLMDV